MEKPLTLDELSKQFSDATGISADEFRRTLEKFSLGFPSPKLEDVAEPLFPTLDTVDEPEEKPKKKNRMGFLEGLNYRGTRHSQHFKK